MLKEENERLVEAIKNFDPKRLDRKPDDGGETPYVDLMMGIVMHDTYHTGQIQTLKRLFAAGNR